MKKFVFAAIGVMALAGSLLMTMNKGYTAQYVKEERWIDLNWSSVRNLLEFYGFGGGVINNGSRRQPEVALTFDADMTPYMLKELKEGEIASWYEKSIVDILHENSASDNPVKATFFVTGMWAETYPDEIKKFAEDPLIEIGNHSYDHAAFNMPCYGLWQADDKVNEVEKAADIIEKLIGKKVKYFRFPGGCYDANDVKLVNGLNEEVIGWDVISGDAYLKKADNIVKKVLAEVKNGSIVVMHLNGGPHAPATADALGPIIKGLSAKGYKFVTVSELLGE